MLPTTAKTLHRFVPDIVKDQPTPPTYLLTVPTKRLRAQYDWALTANGVRTWTRDAQFARVREVVASLNADNKQELIDLLDRLDAIAARPAPADGAPMSDADEQDLRDWRGLEVRLISIDPVLQQMVADNRFYVRMAPQICARVFIAGWENRKDLFQRGADGLMAESLLEGIDDIELTEIWAEVLKMLRPSEAEAKNSASPQPSSQDPATSPAASSPLTDQPGNSSESGSSGTPASA